MVDLKPEEILFVGKGQTAVCYYRCMLPAMAIGADWMGVYGAPPNLAFATGLVRNRETGRPDSILPDMRRYKVIVVQQPEGKGWIEAIKLLQNEGVKILFEIDDYLHGIPNLAKEEHDFRDDFDKKFLGEVEAAMKACDGLIASTDFIAEMYRHFQKRTFVCRNGLDVKRYALTLPDRPTVNVGWAGGTGHNKAVIPWLQHVAGIMRVRPNVNFVSIGQPFAKGFAPHFDEDRWLAIPWAAIETYPAAMTMMDIALAPGGGSAWWRGKSDLRWLEASALAIPAICRPDIYPDVVDGETGFTADSPKEMSEKLLMLIDDEGLRTSVGQKARANVRATRSIGVMADQWRDCFDSLLGS